MRYAVRNISTITETTSSPTRIVNAMIHCLSAVISIDKLLSVVASNRIAELGGAASL
jgi:hypothetical protein